MMRGLRRRTILPDLLAGIWMIVKAIAERNYLQASNIYMSLSVGELSMLSMLASFSYQELATQGRWALAFYSQIEIPRGVGSTRWRGTMIMVAI